MFVKLIIEIKTDKNNNSSSSSKNAASLLTAEEQHVQPCKAERASCASVRADVLVGLVALYAGSRVQLS